MSLSSFLYFSAITLPVLLPALGVSVGQSSASRAALDAMNVQPSARDEIMRALVLGLALMETAGVMSISLSILLLFDTSLTTGNLYTSIALAGIPFAILSGLILGYVSSWATAEACFAIARQPFSSQRIINLLLLAQSFLQTPFIFGFFVAWFIKTQAPQAHTLIDATRLLMSGFVIGVGSIGPVIGLAKFAKTVMQGIGKTPSAYAQLMTFTLFSQAIIETPIIFAFVVSLLMLFTTTAPTDTPLRLIAFIAAAFSTSFGVFGPGINSGRIATAACEQIALRPDMYSVLARASMFAQALMDTFVVYSALVSFILILLIGK
jgi:F0F1-type ATP synthase membrane subunit c/vacuolar-type H+-ATPase subunit K